MSRGRKPNLRRQDLMQRLRAEGYTLAGIARQLGVSRQAVYLALRRQGVARGPLHCCHCRAPIGSISGPAKVAHLLCGQCLALPHILFAQRLASLRFLAGLTQEAVAQATGISRPSISQLESGTHQPREKTRQRLLAYLEPFGKTRRFP